MERHGDHRLDLAQVHINTSVIICHSPRIQLFVIFTSSMDLVELLDLLVCRPDRGQAGRLCCHNVDADTEVSAQLLHARSDELHYLVIHIAILKYRSDDRKRNVLRSYALHRLAVQIDRDHARHLDIISLVKELFYKLRSALAHSHRSKRSVAGMAV